MLTNTSIKNISYWIYCWSRSDAVGPLSTALIMVQALLKQPLQCPGRMKEKLWSSLSPSSPPCDFLSKGPGAATPVVSTLDCKPVWPVQTAGPCTPPPQALSVFSDESKIISTCSLWGRPFPMTPNPDYQLYFMWFELDAAVMSR